MLDDGQFYPNDSMSGNFVLLTRTMFGRWKISEAFVGIFRRNAWSPFKFMGRLFSIRETYVPTSVPRYSFCFILISCGCLKSPTIFFFLQWGNIGEEGRTLGKTYGIKVRCYWEHPWGTHWQPREHIENLMGIRWDKKKNKILSPAHTSPKT